MSSDPKQRLEAARGAGEEPETSETTQRRKSRDRRTARSHLFSLPPLLFLTFLLLFPSFLLKENFQSALATRENVFRKTL